MASPSIGPESVRSVLTRRGQVIAGTGDVRHILLPLDQLDQPLSGEDYCRFLKLFGRASFRKVARLLLRRPRGPVPLPELESITGNAREYVDFLVRLRLAELAPAGVLLTRPIHDIGLSLEWYVAQLCQRVLQGSAEWSVKLEGLPAGGDFDVLAWLPPTLLYVEVKSAAPTEVTDSELLNFLQRAEELAPDMAVLLIDTDDSLADPLGRLNSLMLPPMRAVMNESPDWQPEQPFIQPQAGYFGIHFGHRRVYVTNAKPAILTQLRRCLKHYHARVKNTTWAGGPPVNFLGNPAEPDD
jgi:hypothetical protein